MRKMLMPRRTSVLPVPRERPSARPVRVPQACEVLDDEVALGDELVEVAVPVGQRGPDDMRGLAHALRPVGGAGERRVVVDEVVGEVAVDGGEVALGEELLDEGSRRGACCG